jgi:hypothetical protein
MARTDVFRVRSDKDTHFTGAIVQNAAEQEDNDGRPGSRLGVGVLEQGNG